MAGDRKWADPVGSARFILSSLVARQAQQVPLQPVHSPQQGPSVQPQVHLHLGSSQQQEEVVGMVGLRIREGACLGER